MQMKVEKKSQGNNTYTRQIDFNTKTVEEKM